MIPDEMQALFLPFFNRCQKGVAPPLPDFTQKHMRVYAPAIFGVYLRQIFLTIRDSG